LTSLEIFKTQDNTLVEIYEDLFLNIPVIQVVSISIEDYHNHTDIDSNKDDRRSEHVVISSFENGVEFHNIKREAIGNEECPFLLGYQENIVFLCS